jgi:hypothetical protein
MYTLGSLEIGGLVGREILRRGRLFFGGIQLTSTFSAELQYYETELDSSTKKVPSGECQNVSKMTHWRPSPEVVYLSEDWEREIVVGSERRWLCGEEEMLDECIGNKHRSYSQPTHKKTNMISRSSFDGSPSIFVPTDTD